jgi:hypothetical protein
MQPSPSGLNGPPPVAISIVSQAAGNSPFRAPDGGRYALMVVETAGTCRIFGWSASTVETTVPPVGCLKSPEARPLRSEKDDSRKMEKHSWGQFLGISRVVSDARHVAAKRCQIAVTGRFVELAALLGT